MQSAFVNLLIGWKSTDKKVLCHISLAIYIYFPSTISVFFYAFRHFPAGEIEMFLKAKINVARKFHT